MNKDWKHPPYAEKEIAELCQKSSGNDFYFGVGEDRRGKSFVIITPRASYDSYADLYNTRLPIDHLLPEGLTKFNAKLDEWEDYNVWLSDKIPHELYHDFKTAGFVPHMEIHKFIELWFFKKPLPRNMEMEFAEFRSMMELTTDNLKKMRGAIEYMRWQFGNPLYYEEFISEIQETIDGWISSHC